SSGGPSANFPVSTSGLTASFTDTSTDSGGTINAYSWDFGDGSTSTTKSPTHTYTTGGSYTVTEKVTDSVSKTSTHSTTVSVSSGTGGTVERLTNGGSESSATPRTL